MNNLDNIRQRDLEEKIRHLEAKVKSLEQSKNYYKAFFEHSLYGTVIVDPESLKLIEFNDHVCNQLGYTREEFAQLSVMDIEANETNEETLAHVQKIIHQNGYEEFETLHRTKQGEIRNINVLAQYINVDGKQVYHCIWRDITEDMLAEESLWKSREILRAVFDTISVRVFWKDSNLNYLGCNIAFAHDAGFEYPEQIIGKDDLALGWRDQAELYQKDDLIVIREGKNRILFEEPQTTPSGETIHLLTSKVPLRDPNGSIIGVLGTYMDITERKRAEAALLESEDRFSKAFHTSPYAIIITRVSDGKFIETNNAFTAIAGYSKEEAIGGSSLLLNLWVNPEDRNQVIASLNQGYTVANREYQFRRKDGSIMTGLFSAQMIHLGDVPCVLSSINDITELHRSREERDRLQQQLYQAQKMESVGRLAGGVAHDFNNMISIILGYGEMLLDQIHPNDPLRADVNEIVKAANRSSELTRQLLAFARKQTLQPEVLLINDIVRNFDKMLRRLIGEDIELQIVLGEEIVHVLADRGQIEQVITNLAVNARDAMPTGGKLIIETGVGELDKAYAEIHPDAKPGRYATLFLSDNGCGMDKEVLSQIFEPFFTTKEMGRGTGLGLSTVYGIIKQSNGHIWVYSEPGHGTVFKIYLPETSLKPALKTDTYKEPTDKGDGQQILVVEDEVGLRRLLEGALSRLGYKVIMAANGGEALLIMEEKGFKPDLIITDVVMPNMSGRELVDRLRTNRPDLKVIYMSGYTDDIIVHHGVINSENQLIQKPFTIREIAKKIREILI